ncbi:cache domain-containing protein [Desulfobulbus sp.]|uniref:cache domain-containing protein n=1 Tax=Desulfobulbus sp. TaxID=895 RepID=UPI00286EBA41|nr:cache domain-containing protein [Desulfobulbus sp.]
MKKIVNALICSLLLTLFATSALAETSPERLAAESEAYVRSTAKDTPTAPAAIVTKVDEACALLAKEGPAAFPRFKGKGSPFLFDGTYIWIHSLKETRMLMHPIKYKMEGNELIGLKDERGKRFFVAMNDVANEPGQGWVAYYWPVPGTKDIVRKVSYIKKCTMPNGVDVVIGCGIYNGDPVAMEKLDIK